MWLSGWPLPCDICPHKVNGPLLETCTCNFNGWLIFEHDALESAQMKFTGTKPSVSLSELSDLIIEREPRCHEKVSARQRSRSTNMHGLNKLYA